jgi:membrane protein required for colicin V production
MQAYDLFMLIVLAAAVVWGAWKGLAWQLASLASLVVSYFVALSFRAPLAQLINASPPWNAFLAMLILFLGTGLVVWVGFNLVSEAIEKVKLKEYDRQLGAMFGLAKGVLLCVLITLFSVALLSEPQRQQICNSKSGYYIALLLDRSDAVIPTELHEVLGPYIDKLDQSVAHPHVEGEGEGWQIPQGLQDLIPKNDTAGPPLMPGGSNGSTASDAPTGGFSFPIGPYFNQPAGSQPAGSAAPTTGRIQARPAEPRRW